MLLSIINLLKLIWVVALLVGISLILIGLAKLILNRKDKNKISKAKKMIIKGIIIIFVDFIVSVILSTIVSFLGFGSPYLNIIIN